MTRILVVHGIAQQYKGSDSLKVHCGPALCDGVALAGGQLGLDDVSVAFYGDLFRPKGRALGMPDYDASDLTDEYELDLLTAWADAVDEGGKDRGRTSSWVQRTLATVNRSSFFSGLSERILIGALKQVKAYFGNPEMRDQVKGRVLNAITEDTTVVIGHSLGSVVAYEALCAQADHGVGAFVSLGSPLGIPNLIYDRLRPAPGRWPGVEAWTNIADRGDGIALVKVLSPLFGGRVDDIPVHNGAKAHDIRPYLTARETGTAVLRHL